MSDILMALLRLKGELPPETRGWDTAQRAHDEIVALRLAMDGMVHADMGLSMKTAMEVRAEALEEAALLCRAGSDEQAAIRALKDSQKTA